LLKIARPLILDGIEVFPPSEFLRRLWAGDFKF
jgi:hypothetical protein